MFGATVVGCFRSADAQASIEEADGQAWIEEEDYAEPCGMSICA